MDDISDAAVEALSNRHVLPVVQSLSNIFSEHASNLEWRVHIQVLIEGRHSACRLTATVIKLWRRTVLELDHLSAFAVVDHQPHVLNKISSVKDSDGKIWQFSHLSVPEDVQSVPLAIVETLFGLDFELQGARSEINQQSWLSSLQFQ